MIATVDYTLARNESNQIAPDILRGDMVEHEPSDGTATPEASPMTRQVAMVVQRIPEGRVTTYGRIALAIGSPRSARIVGWTMSRLPEACDAPAHRVVNRAGELSGAHAWGAPEIMRDLLIEEGVPFIGEWRVDLDACLWDPADDDDLIDLLRGLRATG